MKKFLIVLLVLVLIPILFVVYFIAKGTIHLSSISMIFNVATGMGGDSVTDEIMEQRLRAPAGFDLQLYQRDVPKARFLRVTKEGDLLVSRPHSGDIQLLRKDKNGDGKADEMITLISGLNRPMGLDFIGSWLYIAESNQIGRVRYDGISGQVKDEYEVLISDLTDNGNHWTKTLRAGEDGLLYLTQGSSCNVCEEEDERRATMMRFQPDGSNPEIIATGLRNSVGFDWAPWNGEIYATDNGRDLMGDDFPPCELNHVIIDGFYGWPYYNGDNIKDPDMGEDPQIGNRKPLPPVHNFRAHNAPLGISFLNNETLPQEYQRSALVALHGSWNRSSPDGYKVVSLHWTDTGIEERDFLTGFNKDANIIGRPVDIAQGPDGAIYVSDDYASAIYKLTYKGDGAKSEGLSVRSKSKLDDTKPYEEHSCHTCHGAEAGNVSLANLSERLGYNAVINSLVQPQGNMPVFPLSEDEKREIAVYLLHEE